MHRLPFVILTLAVCTGRALADPAVGEPPDILLGIRLFDETRFAQYFWANQRGGVNTPLAEGDPAVRDTVTTGVPLPGPFAAQSFNCRVCHLDVEHKDGNRGGGRNYSDFARRSPVPDRVEDDLTETPRNSMHLINASLPRADAFALHFDGEFASLEALVKGTLTGRNFGWLPDERAIAVAHIARVIREDDGSDPVGLTFGGGSYAGNLRGTDPLFPTGLPLPGSMTVNVETLSDEAILDVVARFLAGYVRSLTAAQDAEGAFMLSPYDVFLRKNGLPARPRDRESPERYSKRLAKLLRRLETPQLVDERDARFLLHPQEFRFGAEELAGMRVFFATARRASPARRTTGGIGNCIACHPAPAFTDFRFHNTGVSQDTYDAVHGAGSFAALAIPDVESRNADPGRYLPASAAHPRAPEPFRAMPSAARPGFADLGLWNVLDNPAMGDAARQKAIARALCRGLGKAECRRVRRSRAGFVGASIAAFKTPGLRDLGHSDPYMHDGTRSTLEDVVDFYVRTAALARAGQLRNPAPQLHGIALVAADVAPLAAFLRSLNEDFE